MSEQGFLTIAYGSEKYVRMAQALGASYRLRGGVLPFAVVTDDASKDALAPYFDHLISVDPSFGDGVVQKLSMDRYSPFEQTLFVDSDCLLYKHPSILWDSYAQADFVVRGWRHLGPDDHHGNVANIGELLRLTGTTRLPSFNGGVIFFRRSPTADAVFTESRKLYERRGELGFTPFKGAPVADEPVMAVAMETLGVEMLPWCPSRGMETWMGMTRLCSTDVLQGRSRVKNYGHWVEPALIHFHVGGQRCQPYLRDVYRLLHPGAPALTAKAHAWALQTRLTASAQDFSSRIKRKSSRIKRKLSA